MTMLEAVGWALVHFVWQGTVVALVAALALWAMRRATATLRYAVAVGALVTMAALPVVTAWRASVAPIPLAVTVASAQPGPALRLASADAIRSEPDRFGAGDAATSSRRTSTNRTTSTAPPTRGPDVSGGADDRRFALDLRAWAGRLDAALPWLVTVWALGVILLSLRLFGGWWRARRLRMTGVAPAPVACLAAVTRLAARLDVRRVVRVLESHRIETPMAMGWLRPVVLLPASALTGLSPDQLDAILAHELAHIRRHDYAVNLAQSVVETVLFYHPAVWWVSRQVRQEREHCCDDLAVAVCGDREGYARALVGMEQLRHHLPLPVVHANGGSLVMRIRRLLTPELTRIEPTPRWAASVIALATALTVGTAAGVPAVVASLPLDVAPAPAAPTPAQTAPAAPPTIVRSVDAATPFAERWTRAEQDARARAWPRYWIGYTVPPPPTFAQLIYSDRSATVRGDGISFSGTFTGDFDNLHFPGVAIAPLVGGSDPRRIKLLFSFTSGGAPARATILARTHLSTFVLPVDLDGQPVMWLGDASAAESLPIVGRLYASVSETKSKSELVSALGIHGDSSLTVPVLVRILEGGDAPSVRAQAAERLAWHATPAALAALERAARTDREGEVRREAAESIGELDLPEATPTLISLAKTLTDREARREAVEALGERREPAARDALVALVQTDRDQDIQREAVETLGELKDGQGMSAVADIARTHPSPEIRREAVETIAQVMPADQAVAFLVRVAREDASVDVQREAVETIGEVKGAQALPALMDIVRNHPRREVRREAVETIGQTMPAAEAAAFLARVAREDADVEVQREAVETLGEIEHGVGRPAVIDMARSHPSVEVRREAVETLRDGMPPAEAVALLSRLAREDQSVDVQREAIESLGQVQDSAAVNALSILARTHPRIEARREAVETLAESSASKEVVALLGAIAREDGSTDVQREAVESLGEVAGGAGLSEVATLALTHPAIDVRREAIETLTEHAPTPTALDVLSRIVATDRDDEARREALESLAELRDGAGVPTLVEIARSHPSREVRGEALKRLVESDDPRARAVFERALTKP
jgi:HEAT repeat protein/beta-lactamase regulating signal transducer with metallopeptidase domain